MSQTQAERHARWQAEAQRRGWPAWRRRPLAAMYGLLLWLRRIAYRLAILRSERLPVPVLVVGNLVVGGAGKTPTVLALLEHLKRRGWEPGVVSRGHGRRGVGVLEVRSDTLPSEGGDEPVLIRKRGSVPVFVCKDRAAAARALLQAHPRVNLLLCDDGLQHLALQRDLAVAVFDERGIGNGWLMPAGLLREPWPPGLLGSLPDLVLQQHRRDRQPASIPLPAGVPCFAGRRMLSTELVGLDGQRLPLSELVNSRFAAVAGIAQPQAFFDMLREQGCQAALEIPLADHAPPEAYAALLRHSMPVVCTEKDLVKLAECWRMGDPPVWAARLELVLDQAFFDAVDERLPAVAR